MDKGNMFSEVYEVLKSNLRFLVIVSVVAIAAGALFSSSWFMKPRFTSSAVIYPINIGVHSEESETEQVLQWMASEEIKEAVMEEFTLWDRWDDLNPGEDEYYHWSNMLYDERVSISPTRFEGIEISCQDETPQVAHDMVELIISTYNRVAGDAQRLQHRQYFELKSNELRAFEEVVDSLEARMKVIRQEGGLLDFQSQSERVVEGYMEMLRSGTGKSQLDEAKRMMSTLSSAGGELALLQDMVSSIQENYIEITAQVFEEKARSQMTYDFYKMVKEPRVNAKKTYPVRWVVVLLSLISGFLAALIFLIVRDRVTRAD